MDENIDSELKAEILDTLRLKDLTSFEQDAIISDLENRIIEQLNIIIIDRLDEDEKAELEGLIEDEEISRFLQRAIPDLAEVKKQAALWVVKQWQKEGELEHDE